MRSAVLTLGGYQGRHAPTSHDDFLAFAKTVCPPHVFAAFRDADWLGDARQHRYPAARRRYYERLTRFPSGFLVTGDGICSFNPLFGQGMTVAAMQAIALREALTGGRDDLASRFFTAAALPVGQAWQMAVSSDRVTLGLPRSALERMTGTYLNRLHVAAERDPVLVRRFFDVTGLVEAPSSLFTPGVLLRVLTGNLRRRL